MADLVTLAQTKDFLSIPTGDTTHDSKLQEYIDAASAIISYAVGPVVAETHTDETHVPNGSRIMLDFPPVLSVTSVTEYWGVLAQPLTSQPPGSTTDNYGYSLDLPNAGLIVRRGAAGEEIDFIGSPIVITYVAGRASVPPDILLATLEDIRGLYQQTQQGGRPGFQQAGSSDQWSAGPLNLFPRLQSMLASSERPPSLA